MWKNIPPSRLAVIIPTRQTGNKLLLKDGPMIKWGERKLCEHKINLVFRYKVTICHPPLFPVQIKATHFLFFFYWTRKMTLKHLDVQGPITQKLPSYLAKVLHVEEIFRAKQVDFTHVELSFTRLQEHTDILQAQEL